MDNSIDIISNVALNSISNKITPNSNAEAAEKTATDTMTPSRFASLLDEAINSPDVDHQAVAQAADILQNGNLDTPGNTLDAARNILTYGI